MQYWRDPALSDLELFAARFRAHKYRRHSHAGYVVGTVTEGREAFYCRGHVHTAGQGDLILINPQSQHDGESACDTGWAYRVIYPREEHFLAVSDTTLAPRFRQPVVRDEDLAGRIVRFHRLVAGPHDLLEAQGLWSGMLFDLVARHAETPPSGDHEVRDPARIARIEAILRAHALEGISLEDVAAEVGWSQWHLVRSFQAAMGTSPYAFALECRLRHAKGLIDAGESLVMASAAAGFVDQSHFSRNFVRAYGFTPGSYQRSMT